MFTGIIENIAIVKIIKKDGDNLVFTFESNITSELKIDQSVSHNGICLTVVDIFENNYSVVAIKETVLKSSIKNWKIGDEINLERAMKIGDRLDGHLVQGHVDQIAICENIKEEKGSWYFSFKYKKSENITIEKGSISVNGISLTVVNSKTNKFSVAIIPYTYNHTNFKNLKVGDTVNLEFDMVGKYISKLVSQ
ncbi:MAG: riboflavin synthase [Bacteroidota bacterium]|nr:riboflavin synthase [Bacteroidota bacterium]MEC8367787.1 riboflavin synthase [Bacteroidota bacterium]MEC8602456.1 riboflavin synthase [Bacteroidota bacterium]|tara:strand:+ start:399 stop:980 length:582 start_codon:yes stop_codon:yes gene_type:complete